MHKPQSTPQACLYGLASLFLLSPFAAGGEEWTAYDGAPKHWFGYSVATSDGWRLGGAPMENRFGNQAGAAYLLDTTIPGGVQEKVTPLDRTVGGRFGWSVDISERVMVVGAPGQSTHFGEVFVFEREGKRWTQTARLSGIPGHAGDGFGYSVAVSGDRVLVGAPFDNTKGAQAGAVYAFSRGKSLWVLDEVLHAPHPFVGDQFGFALDVDGERAVIGAWSANVQVYNEGAAYVFSQGKSGYELEATLQAQKPRPNAMFARSVAVHGDLIAVGATEDHGSDMRSGSVSLFRSKQDDGGATRWNFEDRIQAPDLQVGNAFGYSVGLLPDSVLVGAPLAMTVASSTTSIGGVSLTLGQAERTGEAYVFHPMGPRWGLAKAMAPEFTPAANDYVGISVHHAADGALVGAMRSGSKGYQAGAVHLYSAADIEAPLVASYCGCSEGSPCDGESAAHGCVNSTGESGRLTHHGSTSIQRDDLVLQATGLPAKTRTYFMVGRPTQAVQWHAGYLCVSTTHKEFATLETRNSDRGGVTYTRKSLLRLMDRAGLAVTAGSTWGFQAVYYDRNGPCRLRYNATDALLVTLLP